MKSSKSINLYLIVAVTLLVGLMLDILPLPTSINWLAPHWSLLILVFWIMQMPFLVNVCAAFITGILLDLLKGSLLGEHAFALVVVAYLVVKTYRLFAKQSVLQQSFFIFGFTLIYQIIIVVINAIIGQLHFSWLFWLAAITSAIFWPLVSVLLCSLRKIFKCFNEIICI